MQTRNEWSGKTHLSKLMARRLMIELVEKSTSHTTQKLHVTLPSAHTSRTTCACTKSVSSLEGSEASCSSDQITRFLLIWIVSRVRDGEENSVWCESACGCNLRVEAHSEDWMEAGAQRVSMRLNEAIWAASPPAGQRRGAPIESARGWIVNYKWWIMH